MGQRKMTKGVREENADSEEDTQVARRTRINEKVTVSKAHEDVVPGGGNGEKNVKREGFSAELNSNNEPREIIFADQNKSSNNLVMPIFAYNRTDSNRIKLLFENRYKHSQTLNGTTHLIPTRPHHYTVIRPPNHPFESHARGRSGNHTRHHSFYAADLPSTSVLAALVSFGSALLLVAACISSFVVADVVKRSRVRILRATKVSPLLETTELLM